jgi:uncharacterized membrane protein
MEDRPHRGPLMAAGTLLGAGLGGFIDGIVLHQLLQWHNMLSARVPPTDLYAMKLNMLWDGVFHALVWLLTVAGLVALWRAGGSGRVPWSARTFGGGLVLGWGLFNVVEGILDHHLFATHHVRPGPGQLAWDLGFLIFGAVLCAVGLVLIRRGAADARPRGIPLSPALPAMH